MKPLISVIIPVYNAGKYLESCLESVLSQTWSPLEIILIDDGSVDNSREIIMNYSHRYTNITALYQDNNGVSRARNLGLEAANGFFVAFCDSDDVMSPQMIELLCRHMQETASDLCCCDYLLFDSKEQIAFRAEHICEIVEEDEMYRNILQKSSGYVWNKLFLHSLIEAEPSIRFHEDLAVLEDKVFVLEYLQRCRRMCTTDAMMYGYRCHETSVLHQPFSEKKLTQIPAQERIYDIIRCQTGDHNMISDVWNEMMRTYAICYKKLLFSSAENSMAWRSRIKKGFHQNWRKYPLNKLWNRKEKLYYLLLRIAAERA